MTARSKVFSAMMRCLVCSVALTAIAATGGCGAGVSSQATLDDAAQARVQKAKENKKAFMAKPKKKEDMSPLPRRRR